MYKRMLLLTLVVLALVAGCGQETASPVPTVIPSPETPPTSQPEATAIAPTVAITPSGPASCTVEPLDFPVAPVPPVTEADHTYGPPGAPITFIEYADFQ